MLRVFLKDDLCLTFPFVMHEDLTVLRSIYVKALQYLSLLFVCVRSIGLFNVKLNVFNW